MGRNYRVEVYRPNGQWKWGQWVSGREGYGTLADRLERVALDILATCELAGAFARVSRYVPYGTPSMVEMFAVRRPGDTGPIPPLPGESCPCACAATA